MLIQLSPRSTAQTSRHVGISSLNLVSGRISRLTRCLGIGIYSMWMGTASVVGRLFHFFHSLFYLAELPGCIPGTPWHKCLLPQVPARTTERRLCRRECMTCPSTALAKVENWMLVGRFRSLLLSGSVVIKDTIFREWHDTRLVPWIHYVPHRGIYGQDLWSIVRYFLGDCDGSNDHDSDGKRISLAARERAQTVLRKVDVQLYFIRLLLEWQEMVTRVTTSF